MADLKARLQSTLGDSYRIDEELGGGGMSRVFVASEVRLGRQVVVKVLPPEWTAGVSGERFEREIRMAATLQHPHIVPLLTAGSAGDLLYYIMPRVEGRSLRARLAHEGELPIGEAVRILRDVCDALAYAHARGIVHRDIKPDNVLLSSKHALVTDFGVAKAVSQSTGGESLTSMGLALGTPAYMAPEQALADPNLDHRADLYAVGVLAYEMLTGHPPFRGLSPHGMLAAHATTTPEPIGEQRDSVPPALGALIMRCLAKRPADRWQSANEIVDQLELLATPTGGITPGSVEAAARTNPWRVAGLFALASAALLGVDYFLMNALGLPGWVFSGAMALVIAGVPIVILTSIMEHRRAFPLSRRARPERSEGERGSGGEDSRRGSGAGWRKAFTWRRTRLVSAFAIGALALTAAVHSAMRAFGIGPAGTLLASGVVAERDRLVLAEFENRTTDSTLGPSVSEALRVDLSQSPVMRLLDGAAIAQVLRRTNRPPNARLDPALAQEIAQREGAKAVVRGKIDPLGRGFVLSADLVSAADGAVLVTVRETAQDETEIIEAVDRLSKRLRERIGESLKTIRASDALERVTTTSLEALQKYSQAIRAADAGENDRAAALLEEAVAQDTTFAMAYRKLAAVLTNTNAVPSRVGAAATQAFRHRNRLTPLERHLTEAYYYNQVELDSAKVEDAYRAALSVDPENYVALNNLALQFSRQRRFAEAESLAVRATAANPAAWAAYLNTGVALMAQGKVTETARTVEAYAQRAPGTPLSFFFRTLLAGAQRDFDSAAVLVAAGERASRDPFLRAGNAVYASFASTVRGRLAEADAHVARAMELNKQRSMSQRSIGLESPLAITDIRFRNAPAAALRRVQEALRRHPLASTPAEDRPYLGLAWVYAEAGQPSLARQMLAEYESVLPERIRRDQPFRHGAVASIAFAEGRFDDAIAGYRAWHEEDNCAVCGLFELGRAYESANQRDSALAVYERAVSTPGIYRMFEEAQTLPLTYRRLGELYEERRQLDKAREYYARFVDLWENADPELQPAVRDLRARISALIKESGS